MGTGNFDLNVLGAFEAQVTKDNLCIKHDLEVCEKVNDNLLGIDLINKLGLSFRANGNVLFAIAEETQSWFTTRHEHTFKAQSVTLVTLKAAPKPDHIERERTMIAYVENGAFPSLTGGPALTRITKDNSCVVAITNVAPYDVFCPRRTTLARAEELPKGAVPSPEPLNSQPKGAQSARISVADTEEYLEVAEVERQLRQMALPEEIIRRLVPILRDTGMTRKKEPTQEMTLHYQAVEPHYQKQTKIPEAHRGIVEWQIQD